MTKVYLIRHAEAEGNLYRRIHGQYDSLVTQQGERQIKALEKRFENVHFDAVYSSDLERTKKTASAIYLPKGLELTALPGLREVNMGSWEDVPWGDIEKFNRSSSPISTATRKSGPSRAGRPLRISKTV